MADSVQLSGGGESAGGQEGGLEGAGLSEVDLIDLQIEMLQNPEVFDGDLPDREDPEMHAKLKEVAEKLFGQHLFDPKREANKVDQVVDFLIKECECMDPKSLMSMVANLDGRTRLAYPSKGLVDRLWLAAMETKQKKLREEVARG